MNYWELFKLLVPEAIVVATALVILMVDLGWMRLRDLATRMAVSAGIAAGGCILSLLWLVLGQPGGTVGEAMLVVDPLTRLLKGAILILTVLTVSVSSEGNFTKHAGEYFAILLMATAGMMFLVATENILMIFIALELLSLSLYVLTAFNKENIQSAEAALKYFLFGGMCAAFLLFGLSLLYGLTGALSLKDVAAALGQTGAHLDPLLMVALVLVAVGFGFKVAAVPFHLWAPDAYQGAPIPSAAFIASGSKVASFFILAKVMLLGFVGAAGSGSWRDFSEGWLPLLALLAALSMVLGNLVALVQKSMRRLLAYSAIAHAGYMLLGIMGGVRMGVGAREGTDGMAALLYYALTYGLTTIGAFVVVGVVQDRMGEDRFGNFAGLSRRSPLLSFCLLVFMLSLAGIPPLAGFFGKFYLFSGAIQVDSSHLGLLWLVILAVAMSAVSLYYYLQVLKQVYVLPAPPDAGAIRLSGVTALTVTTLAGGVIVLGCFPNLLLSPLLGALRAAGF